MTRLNSTVVAAIVIAGMGRSALPDDNEARAVVEKGIIALGGEEKLGNAKIMTWKSNVTINGKYGRQTAVAVTTIRGLDQFCLDIEGENDVVKYAATTVVNGDKGWRRFGQFQSEMDSEELVNEKRGIYLAIAPMTLIPIKGTGFKVVTAGQETVGQRPAIGIKVTAPDGKDFKLFFDKESGLPVKQVSTDKIKDDECTSEKIFASYKEFAGVKIATKVEHKVGGNVSMSEEITDFRVLDSVPATLPEPN